MAPDQRHVALALMLVACGGAGRTDALRSPLEVRAIDGIGRCDADGGPVLAPGRPLAVLVHGNQASVDHLAPLAVALDADGYQVVCYRWRQSGRLTRAASDLREALVALDGLGLDRMLVLGHSLGGLAARRALIEHQGWSPLRTPVDLVTIATPFAGVASARTCGNTLLRWVSLGTVASICRRMTRGAKWRDIHPTASMIESPGTLGPWVRRHVHVVTHERGHCRRRAADGRCAKRDHVFSPEEQATGRVEDRRLSTARLDAGHGAAVSRPEAIERLRILVRP